jgi:hypothetical protein
VGDLQRGTAMGGSLSTYLLSEVLWLIDLARVSMVTTLG